MKKFLGILLVLTIPARLLAQATQFYLEDTLGKWKASISLVGDTGAKNQVQEALYAALDHARKTLRQLDTNDPMSEVSQINQKKTKGSFLVSPELAQAIALGIELGQKTGGLLDIAAASPTGSFKNLAVQTKSNSLKLKANNLTIDLQPILKGFLADSIADHLEKVGWKNSLVRLGGVIVTRGVDVNAPWKIPAVVPSHSTAKRAFYYKAKDNACSATVNSDKLSQELTDPRTKAPATSDLSSVTLFTNRGVEAEGLATALYLMGLENSKQFLAHHKNLRALLVDTQGDITHIPE